MHLNLNYTYLGTQFILGFCCNSKGSFLLIRSTSVTCIFGFPAQQLDPMFTYWKFSNFNNN